MTPGSEHNESASAAEKPGSAGEFPSGHGAAELEKALRQVANAKSWNAAEPLPTTREMGEHFGISNATACRLLIRLSDEGVIWRRDNGRYYLNDSRRLVELHKPYACLLRRLQNWSRVYQAVMGGFSQAFGRDPTSMLFVHNETLVRHADTAHPPVHATATEQRSSLAEFFQIHHSGFRGILLDEVWDDRVLAEYATELTNAVIVCRPTSIAGLSSVSADFEAGALLAIGHLYARGYDEIWIAVPYADSVAIDNLRDAATRAATMLGAGIAEQNVCPVASPDDRERFIAQLKSARRRIGVFCLEDNITLILRQAITSAGIECPANVGLLSGMGTDLVTERRISSLRIDYEAIGRTAGEIITSGRVQQITLRPQLVPGETT